ncbi:MAG: NUDIX domain-containing protein [Candidatus Pacebacteria bacterium]|nr:NUDIX domain-containing protein [Candidatus Paceibacterota bacterium]
MTPLVQHSERNPFHISVGAVVVNSEGNIMVHTLSADSVPKDIADVLGGLDTAYILMRESVEDNESLEEAVLRGIQEEFGVEGTIRRYLGSTQSVLPARYGDFEKTTLYFEVTFSSQAERVVHDWESTTLLEWHDPEFLITKMKEQGQATSRGDLDESKIIETYLAYAG